MTWRERIVAARERGHFTQADREEATSWTTCAVGEQHRHYPSVVLYSDCREHETTSIGCGCPDDVPLLHFGDNGHPAGFAYAVSINDFRGAENALDQIEDRVLELKRAHV